MILSSQVAQWTKEISQTWREMTPEQRKTFDEKAVADKQRYEEQMNRYKGRDKNRPKRPQSAYFLWLAGFRTRMKDKIPVNKELLRAAGEHWKRLTDVEKAPYEQMAEGERRKYEEAMRQYNMVGCIDAHHRKNAAFSNFDQEVSSSVCL
jgi:high mobility group protein B1/high mobility group protein B3